MSIPEFLYNANPWWERKVRVPEFKRVEYYSLMKIISRENSSTAYLLTGPRRSGKTTILVQIAEAIHRDGGNAVYIPLDELMEMGVSRLIDVIDYYTKRIGSNDIVFLLDEAQYYENWSNEVKVLIDRFRRKDLKAIFIVTGSSSLGTLIKASEALIGRLRLRKLFPMNIIEVYAFKRKDNNLIQKFSNMQKEVALKFLSSPQKIYDYLYEKLGSHIEHAIGDIDTMIIYGSLPEIIELLTKGESIIEIRRRLLEIIDLVIFKDVLQLQKIFTSRYELSAEEANKITRTMIYSSPSIISFNKISKETGIYIEKVDLCAKLLEFANLIGFAKQYAKEYTVSIRKKLKKIFTLDNGIRNAVKFVLGRDIFHRGEEFGLALENLAMSKALSFLYNLGIPNPELRFWRIRKGQKDLEVDIVITYGETVIGYEIKKGKKRSKISEVFKKYSGGRVITLSADYPTILLGLLIQ